MRGKVLDPLPQTAHDGITPAHAGKSTCRQPSSSHPQDHPRTCGEKRKLSLVFAKLKGSPPHMRGKVNTLTSMLADDGITPAHAGKRLHLRNAQFDDKDHPRTCGEKAEYVAGRGTTAGSPPHMRGKASLC